MLKYAKIVNEEIGLCDIATGTDVEFYRSIGMTQLDVAQSDIDGCWYLAAKCPMKTAEQKAQEERERLDKLSLTKREVFLALYKNKGITPDELKAQITDPEALIEFEYANEYFRGNPLINLIGQKLGYSTAELDYLFENREFPKVVEKNATSEDKLPMENAMDISEMETTIDVEM